MYEEYMKMWVRDDDEARARSRYGAIAQLGEHLLCKQGVVGSIPTGSKNGGKGREVVEKKSK